MDTSYWILYPNLFVFIIGRSGLVRKSTTTGIAVDLLKDVKLTHFMSERLTAASIIKQMGEGKKKFTWEGKEIPQSPVFAYSSELSVLLTEVHGNINSLLTDFYDCRPQNPNNPWVNKLSHEGQTRIYGPCLNILGASTKAWLKNCIPASEMEGGLASRIVFVFEDTKHINPIAWPSISDAVHHVRPKLLSDLAHIHTMVGEMRPDNDARELFQVWYNHHMTEVVPRETDSRMSGYNGRKGELMLKLAMIRSASLTDDLVITAPHLIWAEELLAEMEVDMRSEFKTIGQDRPVAIKNSILEYIKKNQWATLADLNRRYVRTFSHRELEDALRQLSRAGLIYIQGDMVTATNALMEED